MPENEEEKDKVALTAEELAELIKKSAAEAVEGGMAKVQAMMDEKLAGLQVPKKGEDDDKDGEGEDEKGAVVHAEPKDETYAKEGGYGKGPGAFGSFLRDTYLMSKAIHEGTRGPERLLKWQKFVGEQKPTMQEGEDEQGGFLVPTDVGPFLRATTLEEAIAEANGARVLPLRGNRTLVTADVDATHIGSFFGGVIVYRPEETGGKTPSKPTYRQMALTLHKLICLVDVTDELLEDASVLALEADISYKCKAAINFTKDEDFINGTGVGMALGLLSAITPGGCVISVAARPGQPANTIIWENIVDMWTRLHPRSVGNAIWMVNHGCFPQLASMNMAVGAGGVPVWMPAGGISGKPYNTLMGLPVTMTEKCQALGTQGDIILADWRQYLIATKAAGIQAARSMHIYFMYDKQVFRFVLRYDGQPSWAIDLTPLRGPTLSPFVVLATRP